MAMKISNYLLSQIKRTPLNDLLKDSDNQELIKGAGTTFSLKIFGLVFSYLFNIFFARLYGAEIMGLFTLAITVAGILSIFGQMGTRTSQVRFVAQYAGEGNYGAVMEIYKKTFQLVLPLSIFLAVLCYISSPWIANSIFHKPRLIIPLKITAFTLPFGALMGINTASLRGLKKIKDALIFSTVLPPFLNTVGLIGLTYLVVRNYLTPIYMNLLTAFVGTVLSMALWQKQIKKYHCRKQDKNKISINKTKILKVSMPMFMTSAILLIMGWTDTFMLGIFRSASEVGIYRVALRLALFTNIGIGAVNSIAAPKFAELYWKGNNNKLKILTRFSSKIIFWSSFVSFLLTVIFSKIFLGVFGVEFIKGLDVLIMLCTGSFIVSIFGNSGTLLEMTDNQIIFRNVMLVGVVANIILNYYLIPHYGMIGAALATTITTILWKFSASIYVMKIFNFWIGYTPYFIEKLKKDTF